MSKSASTNTFNDGWKTIYFDDSSWDVARQVSADNSPTLKGSTNIDSRAQWIWHNQLGNQSQVYCRRFTQG